MNAVLRFLRNWTLPVAIVSGVLLYFIYMSIPFLAVREEVFLPVIQNHVQPVLLFCMLFVSFCKVDPRSCRLTWWHLWLLLLQGLFFAGLVLVILYFKPGASMRALFESAMLCLICPTATAAAVVTQKLKGNSAQVVTYTVLINLLVSLLIPALTPLIASDVSVTFLQLFLIILRKVFPLLIFPLLLSWLVRFCLPRFHALVLRPADLAFYLWAVALSLALMITTRNIAHSEHGLWIMVGIAVVSFVCCLLQFALGKAIGSRYGERLTAGQAMGQKNTVFAIWLAGAGFFDPITSLAGGFYSIWHNVINSWQLYQMRKGEL